MMEGTIFLTSRTRSFDKICGTSNSDIYNAMFFQIPKSIIEAIEKMSRSFFSGARGEEKKMLWVAWDKLFPPKKEDRFGIRNFSVFNKAL